MANFTVESSTLKTQSSTFKDMARSIGSYRSGVSSVRSRLSISGSSTAAIKAALGRIAEQMTETQNSARQMGTSLEQIARAYEASEKTNTANLNNRYKTTSSFFNASAGGGEAKASVYSESTEKIDGSSGSSTDILTAGASVSRSGEGDAGKLGDLKAEAYAAAATSTVFTKGKFGEASMTADLAKASAEAKVDLTGAEAKVEAKLASLSAKAGGKYGEASASVDALSASANAKVGWSGDFLGAKAGAEASVISGEASGRVGTEAANVHGEASGSAVGADASAKAGVSFKNGKVEAVAKAEAEAYVAKGEVKGGFTFLGVEVNVTGEAMLGVQAEAGGEVGNNKAGGKVGLGPLGVGVEIDWSNLDFTFWD